MTAFVTQCVILAIIVTQASCYTFVGPKVLGQSLSPRVWSDIFQYPLRSYQSSVPLPVLRYYGDAYYSPRNLQNRNYYLPHDSYDDSDYYSNILYYLPTGRSNSYFERAPVNQIEELPELPDYEDDSAEEDADVSKQQIRDWWLEKNLATNEETDLSQLNRVDDLYGRKSAVSKTAPKQNSKNSQPPTSKSRYDGIVDGFGRKKDPEDGTNRPNTRKDKERLSVYGKPVHHERHHEDTDVRDLKSLLRGTPNTDDNSYADSILRRWEAGDKRSGGKAMSASEKNENAEKFVKMNPWIPAKPVNTLTIYDEGGKEIVPEIKWEDDASEQTSVFDTIKTLLALEDEVNAGNLDGKSHKLLKRKPPAYKPPVKNKSSNKDRSRNQGSTTEVIPTIPAGNDSPSAVKRSAGAATAVEDTKSKSYHSNEDTLVRELSSARRQNS